MTLDCVFKVIFQGHAGRLVCYHRDFPHVFPAGFGVEAIEVGPRTDKEGPCLVVFRGVSTAPAALNAWLDTTLLKSAVGRVLWVGSDDDCPASSREGLLAKLTQLGAALGGVLRLQCEPRSLEAWLGDHLPEAVQLHPVNYTHVVHVLHWEGQYRFHAQPAALLYRNSPTQAPRVVDQLSKAAGKVAEALEVAGFHPSSGVAIDMGAAPGGWTAYLAQRMQRVIAIDPAVLDPRALQGGNVTHLACRVEDALHTLQQLVGSAGADMCVCDMNTHPGQLLPLLRQALGFLRPGGMVVFTLKFYGNGRDKSEWEGKLRAELEPEGFEDVQLVWLVANTMSERTCIARKAAAAGVGSP